MGLRHTSTDVRTQEHTYNNRVFGLDLIRAIAIVIVLFGHGKFLLNGSSLEDFPFYKIRFIDGVDLFFVLSGFLIGGIILRDIEASGKLDTRILLHFWKRRWFRTLPTYYLILLTNYIIVRTGFIKEDINHFNFKFLFFSHNFNSSFCCFFWESWSLSVEEWFYIFTPILIFIISRIFSIKISYLFSTIVMITLPILYRWHLRMDTIDSIIWASVFRKTVLCRLDSIGYGLLASWVYFYHIKFWNKIKTPSFIMGISLMLFIIIFNNQPYESYYKQIIYFSLSPLSVMMVIPLTESYKTSKGIISSGIQYISKISYSLYLINMALVAEVLRDHFAPKNGIDSIVKYLIFWVIALAGASLLYHYFEKPVMDLRDKRFPNYKRILESLRI